MGTPLDQAERQADVEGEPLKPADAWAVAWPQTSEEFERLMRACADSLVRYAFRRLGNVQDAEDAVQEVFVRAFADRLKRRNVASVIPYLYRMTANACVDVQRRRRIVEVPLDDLDSGSPRDPKPGPREAAACAQELERAERFLAQLPPDQAEAIRLRVFDGLRLREIAVILGCRLNTVSAHLRYGFSRLRQMASGKDGTNDEMP